MAWSAAAGRLFPVQRGMQERSPERVVLAHEAAFELGAVRFHPAHRLVEDRQRSIVVEPRVMQIFVALGRAGGAILSRDDIMERCWNGRIVGDNALHRAVRHARKALEQVGDGTLQIDTIKGVGYRLRNVADPYEPQAGQVENMRRGRVSRRVLLAAIGSGSVALAGGYFLFAKSPRPPSKFAMNLYAQAEAARKSEYMGSREQAVALYRDALRDTPAFPAAWAGLALTYAQMMSGALDSELAGLASLALSAADRCLQIEPDNFDGNLARTVVPSPFRRWAERKSQLQYLARRHDETWTLNAYLGRVAADVGDAGSAVDYFRRAHSAQPASAGMAGQLANALWSAGMMHDLDQLLDVGSKRWQRSWFVWTARFNYLAFTGQFDAAAEHVRSTKTLPFSLHPNAVEKRLRLVRALRDGKPQDVEASRTVYLAEAVERPQHVRNAGLALAALGARDELLSVLEGYLLGKGKHATPINIYSRRPTFFLFLPPFEQFWKDSSFLAMMNEVGLRRRNVP